LAVLTMKELLEAGVHFGHQTRRWNPKMKRFIYGGRNGIYIIDLHQTLKRLEEASDYVRAIVAAGGNILFVGTKKQAQEAIVEAARRCGMYYVSQRWLGGMLTNLATVMTRVAKLKELREMAADGRLDRLPKKEKAILEEQMAKLERLLTGIENMPRVPDLVFVVDLKKEHIAIEEAKRLEIPLVGIVDTNCDPEEVTYPVPANDDAIRAIKLICGRIADAVLEGKAEYEARKSEEKSDIKLLAEPEPIVEVPQAAPVEPVAVAATAEDSDAGAEPDALDDFDFSIEEDDEEFKKR
jgi:small subunit ribosomal protein S2